ncbi:hypothetical protein [Alkalicoccus chagannorensis]|uniref:hypothetical protein n=1 Tax=Alkalicoccus chagannorensis TaxID=427072 RepID=UPI0003F7FBF4|nr:hypothetical protein [Alkalicoccus chagannorensis]
MAELIKLSKRIENVEMKLDKKKQSSTYYKSRYMVYRMRRDIHDLEQQLLRLRKQRENIENPETES